MVHQQTGGLSLALLRPVLTKWALHGISRNERVRRLRRTQRLHPDFYPGEPVAAPSVAGPMYRVDSYRYEREPFFDDEPTRLIRPRREYREALTSNDFWADDLQQVNESLADESLGVSLPIEVI